MENDLTDLIPSTQAGEVFTCRWNPVEKVVEVLKDGAVWDNCTDADSFEEAENAVMFEIDFDRMVLEQDPYVLEAWDRLT